MLSTAQNSEAGTPFEPRSGETLEEQPHYFAGSYTQLSDAFTRAPLMRLPAILHSMVKVSIISPMPETVDWEDITYQKAFDDETRLLTRRRASEASCTIDDIQGILDALYILDGNNAEGRSAVQQLVLSATIAAYEAFIHQWKKELADKT